MTGRRLALASAVSLGLLLPVLGGCGTAGLDVQYPAAGVNRAVLASAPPRRVGVGLVADRRTDPTRIGVDAKSGDRVVTARPVTDIVRDALVAELGKNGHSVLPDARDVVLAAAVEEFRLDEIGGYGGAQLVGRVVIALSVVDGRSGETLLTTRYVGIKRRHVDKASDAARQEAMEAALARTMHDLATDPALARALGAVHTAS